jgi:dolichol-phosphate mannosyltransferase
LGIKTRDATAGFKAWRRSALEAIDVRSIRANGYLFQEEMVYLCERLGLRIREIPIFFADRQTGRSKMSTKTKLEAAIGLIRLRRRHRKVRPRRALVPE